MTYQKKEMFADRYVRFCYSPLRHDYEAREQILTDLKSLVSQEMVTKISFYSDRVFQVETKTIHIAYQGCEYKIGNFLIYIIRYKTDDGIWKADFRFRNLTDPIEEVEESQDPHISGYVYMHPHIIDQSHQDIADMSGRLCIKNGHHGVYLAIRCGEISRAVKALIQILRTYQDTNPYLSIGFWPHKRKGE